MKKLIIHIGTAKTGTSAIQKFLHENRGELKEHGVLYPLSGQFNDHSHHELAFSFSPDGYRDDSRRSSTQILEDLSCEISDSKCNTIVLSSECFPCLLDFKEFEEQFQDYEVYVMCFLRDPAAYIESWYRQWVKDTEIRYAEGFDVFFDQFSPNIGVKSKLSPWLEHINPNNIVVKDFDEIKKNSDICIEFLKLLNIIDHARFKKVSEVNQSLGYVGTKIMETSNQLGKNPDRNKLLGCAIGIKDYDEYLGKKIITEAQAKIMEDLYLQENKLLLETYCDWVL